MLVTELRLIDLGIEVWVQFLCITPRTYSGPLEWTTMGSLETHGGKDDLKNWNTRMKCKTELLRTLVKV